MQKKLKFLGVASLVVGLAAIVNFGNANAVSAACVDNTYRKGSTGTCVRYIQTLNNYYAPWHANYLVADGVFGTKTDTSIRVIQDVYGLQNDGIVGPKTWSILCTTQMGYLDANGVGHPIFPARYPKAIAEAAGCARYWF